MWLALRVFTDLPLDELRTYRPDVAEPADFDAFWNHQVTAADVYDLDARFEPVDAFVTHAEVFDVTFSGHGGDRIRAWLLVPHELAPDAPVVVEFIGYGGGRGRPLDWLSFSCAGYPHLIMDTRGQGGEWQRGDTPDRGDHGAPSTPGFLTRGIEDPHQHYYTRLFVDAARAVAAARAHPVAEGRRIVTTGRSQGGGLSLAAANLSGARSRSPTVLRTARSSRTAACTWTASTRSSRRCPTSTW
jgi:cephalosporin-C deacetylase